MGFVRGKSPQSELGLGGFFSRGLLGCFEGEGEACLLLEDGPGTGSEVWGHAEGSLASLSKENLNVGSAKKICLLFLIPPPLRFRQLAGCCPCYYKRMVTVTGWTEFHMWGASGFLILSSRVGVVYCLFLTLLKTFALGRVFHLKRSLLALTPGALRQQELQNSLWGLGTPDFPIKIGPV